MNEIFRWINIFIRDILLIAVITYVNYHVHFNSWWAACITGMLIVLTTWHLSDLLETKRGII